MSRLRCIFADDIYSDFIMWWMLHALDDQPLIEYVHVVVDYLKH